MQGKMVPRHELLQNTFLHIPKLDYDEGVYEWGNHVGEKALNSNLWPKLGLTQKLILASFPNRLLENI